MLFRQTGEVVEGAGGIVGTVAIDAHRKLCKGSMMSRRAWVLSRASSSMGVSRRLSEAVGRRAVRTPRNKMRRAGSPSSWAKRGRMSSAAPLAAEA